MPKILTIVKKTLFFSFKATAIIAGLTVVGGLATWLTIQVLINKKEVEVPDLVGMKVQEAMASLDALDLRLSIQEDNGQYSDDIPAEHIIKQDPPAGTKRKTDRRIKVMLSLGSGSMNIPELEGQATQKARILLQKRGLMMGRIGRIYSTKYPPNTIIAQDPAPGASQKGDKEIGLLESLGPDLKYYMMPDFTYYGADAVIDYFRRYNIRVRMEYRTYEGLRDGIVIQTKPHPGYPLRENDIVSIYVSRGSAMLEERSRPTEPGRRGERGRL